MSDKHYMVTPSEFGTQENLQTESEASLMKSPLKKSRVET